jgi:hypothetical protein
MTPLQGWTDPRSFLLLGMMLEFVVVVGTLGFLQASSRPRRGAGKP